MEYDNAVDRSCWKERVYLNNITILLLVVSRYEVGAASSSCTVVAPLVIIRNPWSMTRI